MRFQIGQIVCNRATQENGRIVRIADPSLGNAYIVEITLSHLWNEITKEALWLESQIKKTAV